MKHIRLFEDFDDDENFDADFNNDADFDEDFDDDEDFEHHTYYDEGDYVKLDKNESEWNVIGSFSKIIEVNNLSHDESGDQMFEPRYKVNSIDMKDKSLLNFWIGEHEIDCKLNPDEIKEFELLLTASKFNI